MDDLRRAFTDIYDNRSYENDIADDDEVKSDTSKNEEIESLLRFCLRRPPNAGMLSTGTLSYEIRASSLICTESTSLQTHGRWPISRPDS